MAGSVAVLAGLVAVSAGFHEGDAIAALIVAVIIFLAAARLIFENARVLMDTTPAEAHARAYAAISDLGDRVELRRLRVRESGGHYFADAVVAVPPGQAVVEGQEISEEIRPRRVGDSGLDIPMQIPQPRGRLENRRRACDRAPMRGPKRWR